MVQDDCLHSRLCTTLQAAGGRRAKEGPPPFKDTSQKKPPRLLLISHWPHLAFREAGKYGFYSGQLKITVSVLRKMDIRGRLSVCHLNPNQNGSWVLRLNDSKVLPFHHLMKERVGQTLCAFCAASLDPFHDFHVPLPWPDFSVFLLQSAHGTLSWRVASGYWRALTTLGN